MTAPKNFILGIATIAGTIIGVGFFALPYITLETGVLPMVIYFVLLGGLVLLIHLLFGEVAMATPDFARLPGYARIYLGKPGKWIAFVSMIFGFYGALLAYILIGGEFLSNILKPVLGGSAFLYAMIYFLAGAICVFWGIKAIAKINFWGLLLFFIILAIIAVRGFSFIKIENLSLTDFNLKNLFLPYGPILFSLWGTSIIPEVEEMLGRNKNLLRKAIITGVLISAAVYLFFIFLILGITGSQTSQEAITGLKNILGNGLIALAFAAGIITTFTSFLCAGLTLRNAFWYDLKIPRNFAALLVLSVPLLLFLAGLKNFIGIIGLVGGAMLGIDGILILLMYRKIKPQRFWVLPLVLVLLGGIVYQVIYFVK